MKQKNITIVVDQEVHDLFQKDFETKTGGVQFWTNSFNILKMQTLSELKGKFIKEELICIADCYNSTMLEPNFLSSSKYLIHQLEDFQEFENGITRHKADPEKLMKKVKELTAAQTFFLVVALKSSTMHGNSLEQLLNYLTRK